MENGEDLLNPMQQGFVKCVDKGQRFLSNKSMVAPTKLSRQDEKVKMNFVSPMEKDEVNTPRELYTQLFDEVEKIRCWKVKMDSDIVQKEMKLDENERTIETQRKAIQELQFGNVSLSIKLEEQIGENEELRNKTHATRHLCHILKYTFERSAEKMHLFEREREETRHLLLKNHEIVQKLTEAFEILHAKAEANQEELLEAKGLLQFKDLEHQFQHEYKMKEEEVEALQTNLKDNGNKLEESLLDLQQTKEKCRVLQEEIGQKCDLLKSSNAERDSLLEKVRDAEQRCKDTEAKQEAVAVLLEESTQEYAEILQTKDLSLRELTDKNCQQIEKLGQMQMTVDQLQESLTVETQKAKDLEDKVTANNQELERTKTKLGEMIEQSAKKDKQIKTLMERLDGASKSYEAINGRMALINDRVEELTAELLNKTEEAQQLQNKAETFFTENESLKKAYRSAEKLQEDLRDKSTLAQVYNIRRKFEIKLKERVECQKENTMLKRQMAKEIVKSSELQDIIDSLQEEKQNLKRLNEEERQKLFEGHRKESDVARELQNEVQKLRSITDEAIRNKEEAELKCQNKITHMIALMEKHKRHYDQMAQEKDAELEAKKKRERKAVAHGKSLELELSKQKTECDSLKKQLNVHITEKETLQKELTDLKMEVKTSQPSGGKNKQSPPIQYKEEDESETPKEISLKRSRYNAQSKTRKTCSTKNKWSAAVPRRKTSSKASDSPSVSSSSCRTTLSIMGIHKEALKTPQSVSSSSSSKIKTYRILTPPSAKNRSGWGRDTIELEPMSDSSDEGDFPMFANKPVPVFPDSQPKASVFKQNQSPVSFKSQVNNSKLNVIKRLRDAGWTTVTGSDTHKKKKTDDDKIFA